MQLPNQQLTMPLHALAAATRTPSLPSDSQFPVVAPNLQQHGLSYEQMAQMALKQFCAAPSPERKSEKIDAAVGSSPSRSEQVHRHKKHKSDMH
jgi:hypothetical protein